MNLQISKTTLQESEEVYTEWMDLKASIPELEIERVKLGEQLWKAYEALRKARIIYDVEDKTPLNEAYNTYKEIEGKRNLPIQECKDKIHNLHLKLEHLTNQPVMEARKIIRQEREQMGVSSFVKIIGQPLTLLKSGGPVGLVYNVQTNIYQLRRYNQILADYDQKIMNLRLQPLSKLIEVYQEFDKTISDFNFTDGEIVKDIKQTELDELREIERRHNTTLTSENIGKMSPEAWKTFGEHIL